MLLPRFLAGPLAYVSPPVIRVFARIFYRRAEYFYLCPVARRRNEDCEALAAYIGCLFKEKTKTFTAISHGIYPKPGHGSLENFLICWEAPIAITVWLNDEPVLGLGVEFRGNILCIRQLQGATGVRLPRTLYLWPRIFIQGCFEFAADAGIKSVRLYRAHTSLAYEHPSVEPREGQTREEAKREVQKRMRKRYDDTATELGFTMKKHWGERLVAPQTANSSEPVTLQRA